MKNKALAFTVSSIYALVVILSPGLAQAISDKQRKLLKSGVYYYNTEDNSCIGGPGGNGPLLGVFFPKINDKNELANRIRDYITNTKPSSPLKDFAEDFVKYGDQYNMNPAMLVAVAQVETGLATTGYGTPPKHNFWNERASSSPDGWNNFPSYPAAIEDYYKTIREASPYKKAWDKGDAVTVADIINISSPPVENNVSLYLQIVNDVMPKILNGLDGNASGPTLAAPIANPCNSSGAGAFGWELSGPNAMVSYDQTDPKWSNLPYGAGKTSIGASGCGPSSLAMIGATLLKRNDITPLSLANQYGAQYHTDGTTWALMPVFAADYGLKMTNLGKNLSSAGDILRQGGLVLVSVGAGHFTGGGHFMVIRAVSPDGNSFYLNDPNGDGRNNDSETKSFTAEFMLSDGAIKNMWGYTK